MMHSDLTSMKLCKKKQRAAMGVAAWVCFGYLWVYNDTKLKNEMTVDTSAFDEII